MGCIFLRLFGAPTAERIRLLLYWPHTSALVAYNGGTSVGHGPVRTLFLEPDVVPTAGTLDVGHGLDSFLGPDFESSANDSM